MTEIGGKIEISQMNSHLICTIRPLSSFPRCFPRLYRLTYDIFKDVADELTGVSSFHDHGFLPFLHQLGGSALQEPL